MNHQHDASTAGAATPANEKALEAATNSDKGLGKSDLINCDFRSTASTAQPATYWGIPIELNEEEIAGAARLIEQAAGAVSAAEFSRAMLDALERSRKAKKLERQAARLKGEARKLGTDAYSLRKQAWDKCMSDVANAATRKRVQP